MSSLKVIKSLQPCVNLNGMLVDSLPLYMLGIIDKEIACTVASKHDLVNLVGMVMTCYIVVMAC